MMSKGNQSRNQTYVVEYETHPLPDCYGATHFSIRLRVKARDEHDAHAQAERKLCPQLPEFDPRLRQVVSVRRLQYLAYDVAPVAPPAPSSAKRRRN